MKRNIALILIFAFMVCAFSGCGHKHTPGPAATCTEPQICLECEEVLVEALGHEPGAEPTCSSPQTCVRCGEVLAPALDHTPGAAATCTEPQTCTVCGEVLAKALGHSVNENGECSVCSLRVIPEGQKYVAPGNSAGYVSDDTSNIIGETVSGGHYNNNINAFYANAVLVCGDYGMEYSLPSTDGNPGYAEAVNQLVYNYPDVNVTNLLVPKCCAFYSPAGYTDPYEQTEEHISATYAMMDSSVKTADCFGVMAEHVGEYMFYRTDHHWTSLGAYYASVAYCEANGIEPLPLESYETVVKTDFTGTLYGYADNSSYLKQNLDYTVGHFPQTGYSMVYKNSGAWYDGSAINGDSKSYAGMFICGDNPLTVITTANKNGKNLIIFKESYGNAFVPYMIDYYETVVVVDIRSFDSSVKSVMEEYNITDALIINNTQAAVSFRDTIKSLVNT